ncbi:hypothetical protein ACJIZ3_019958 [Penstemon smallii]|uniref:non-specific serine/threonine protein kinase n=1 Tax=Penstemon smallii TaxID=265156 RepID=A0ABD3T2L4_9LAMI
MLFCLMLAASIAILLVSLCTCFLNKKKRKGKGEGSRSLKEDSWDIKSFHMLTFSEDEILDSIKEDNLIGKGGCGNVYRVVVGNNDKLELAVKHIWHYNKKLGSSSTPMLGGKSFDKSKSREFEAEVKTLSSIRHINVVKLYCSITSEDSSLLVYEYMPNGKYGYTNKVNEKSDLYSFGVVLMELVTGPTMRTVVQMLEEAQPLMIHILVGFERNILPH